MSSESDRTDGLDEIKSALRETLKEQAEKKKREWIPKFILSLLVTVLTVIVGLQGNNIAKSNQKLNEDQALRLEQEFENQQDLKYLELFYEDIKSPKYQENAISLLRIMRPDLALKLASRRWSQLTPDNEIILNNLADSLSKGKPLAAEHGRNLMTNNRIDSLRNLNNRYATQLAISQSRIEDLEADIDSLSYKLMVESGCDTSILVPKDKYVRLQSEFNSFKTAIESGEAVLQNYEPRWKYENLMRRLSGMVPVKVLDNPAFQENLKSIQGIVTDQHGIPVSNLELLVKGHEDTLKTDRTGKFIITYEGRKSGGFTQEFIILDNGQYESYPEFYAVIGSYLEVTLQKKQ